MQSLKIYLRQVSYFPLLFNQLLALVIIWEEVVQLMVVLAGEVPAAIQRLAVLLRTCRMEASTVQEVLEVVAMATKVALVCYILILNQDREL